MYKRVYILIVVLISLMAAGSTSFACKNKISAECRHETEQAVISKIAELEDARSLGGGKLVKWLNHQSAFVRARAALALGRIGEPEAWLPLTERLDDSSSKVREAVIFALGQLKAKESEDILIGQYRLVSSLKEQILILEELGKFGAENTLSLFNEVLSQDNPKLLAAAGKALGVYGWRMSRDNSSYVYDGPVSIISSLKKHLQNHDAAVRWSVAYASWRLKLSGTEKGLINALSDSDNIVRLYTAKALGAIKSNDALLPLAKLADDPDWRVQVETLRAIGTIRDRRGVYYIREVLEELTPLMKAQQELGDLSLAGEAAKEHVALAALETLAQLGGDEARDFTVNWCEPVLNKGLGARPALSLGCLKALSMLVYLDKNNYITKWGRSKNPEMRRFAALSLGETSRDNKTIDMMSIDDHITELLSLVRDRSFKVQAAALDSLGKLYDNENKFQSEELNQKIMQTGLLGLKSGDVAVASASISLLGKKRTKEVVEPLITAYYNLKKEDQGEARQAALEVLKRIDDPRVLPLIRYALGDSDAGVVSQAKEAYEKITGKKPPVARKLFSGQKKVSSASCCNATVGAINEFPADYEKWVKSNFNVEMLTSRGKITMQLFSKDAPLTVRNFVILAKKGYYNRLNFHRVVSDFVIQGGCPRGDGYGGPGYAIRDEINQVKYDTGMLGIALSGKDTGGSQFFITHSPQPHLDGRYVIFGKVTKGMYVVDSIQPGDLILKVTVNNI